MNSSHLRATAGQMVERVVQLPKGCGLSNYRRVARSNRVPSKSVVVSLGKTHMPRMDASGC